MSDVPPPWYRQAWPWFLISLPAAAVVGGIATMIIAVKTNDGVVSQDYYKRGLSINDEIKRNDRAAALGLSVQVETAGLKAGDPITIRLAAKQPMPPEAVVRIAVARGGASDIDATQALGRVSQSDDGRQATFSGALRDDIDDENGGKIRELVVESSSWRLQMRAQLNGNSLTVPAQ